MIVSLLANSNQNQTNRWAGSGDSNEGDYEWLTFGWESTTSTMHLKPIYDGIVCLQIVVTKQGILLTYQVDPIIFNSKEQFYPAREKGWRTSIIFAPSDINGHM